MRRRERQQKVESDAELAALPTEQERLGTELRKAIAAFFAVEPEQVHGYVVACERDDPAKGGISLSTCWSADTPVWRLESFAREALVSLGETLRGKGA